MSRHITDHADRTTMSHRLAAFIKQDRQGVPSNATRQLQRRRRDSSDAKRVEEFVRIERHRQG